MWLKYNRILGQGLDNFKVTVEAFDIFGKFLGFVEHNKVN